MILGGLKHSEQYLTMLDTPGHHCSKQGGINCQLQSFGFQFLGRREGGNRNPRRREVQDRVFPRKKERLPGNPLGNLVGLGIVAPTLHLDCKQPSSEVTAKESSDRFNVMGKEHPTEGGPQL